MNKHEIQSKLTHYLTTLFDIPEEKINLQADLAEDLDLDSIDAIDLLVKLQEFTGKKINPEDFRSVKSVGDVVDRVHGLFA